MIAKSEMKKRNWTLVLYDDSCSKDWEEYLVSTGVPFAYAYHDKDMTEIGEPKKPHYHVVLCFDGPITYSNVEKYAARIGAANGVVQPVGSVRGIIRYFCHKDNPDKYQYSEDVIQCKRAVTRYIRDNDIQEYADLVDTLMDSEQEDMYDIATQNTFFFTQYIKSRRNLKKERDD